MFTCNEEKQVVEGPHHPFSPLLPSHPRDCSTAPASSCSAAKSPLRDQYSLSGWGQPISKPLQAFVAEQEYKHISNTSFGIITPANYIDVLAVLRA